jgi:hypothetical protein
VLQHLGVTERDRRASGPLHQDPYPPDEVLPEIDEGLACRGRPDLVGSKLFLPTDGRTDVRGQRAEVELGRVHACPSFVREAALEPGVRVASCIDGLPVVEVVEYHCRRSGRPALVGHDGLDVAVGKLDLELRQCGKFAAVVGASAAPAQLSAKPTIAQRETKHRPGPEE